MKKFPGSAFLIIITLSLSLAACGEIVEKGLKPSADWSRGVPLADTVDGAVGIVVAETGEGLYLTWPEHTTERTYIHFLQIDQDGLDVAHQRLEFLSGRQRFPRLTYASEDQFHLFWIRRPPREDHWELWHTLLDLNGNIVGEQKQLNSEGTEVSSYDLVSDGDGSVYLVCECSPSGGIYGLSVQPDGESTEMVNLTPLGRSPSLRADPTGTLHMAWFEGTQVKYASFSSSSPNEVKAETIVTIPSGTGDTIQGPNLGLSNGWIYLFWSTLSRSGLEAGTARTEYVAFPKGNPEAASREQRISILPTEDQPYRSYEGEYSLSGLVEISSIAFSSDYIYEPYTALEERQELAVGLVTKQDYRQDVLVQPGVLLFEGGRLKGYSMAGKTLSFSRDPVLAIDRDGNFHLVWREGSTGERAFYATTSDETRSAVDRLTGGDLVNMMLRGGLEGFAAILLFPLALPWLVPGLIIVLVWRVFRDQDDLDRVTSRVILIFALITYQIAKFLFVPTILTYTPFSAWIDVPNDWVGLLRVGVPLMIFFIGIGLAERTRRRNPSPILYFVLASVTDMVLTLGIYGVSFFGVF